MLCRVLVAFLAALTLCGCPTASPAADADATIDAVDVPSIATLCAAALSPGCWGDPSVPPSCRCRAMLSHIRPDVFPLVADCLAHTSGSDGLCPNWIGSCGMALQSMGTVQPTAGEVAAVSALCRTCGAPDAGGCAQSLFANGGGWTGYLTLVDDATAARAGRCPLSRPLDAGALDPQFYAELCVDGVDHQVDTCESESLGIFDPEASCGDASQ